MEERIKETSELREPDVGLDRLAHNVIGAAIEVHRALGPGLLESVYESALAIELQQRGIPFSRQPAVSLRYRGEVIGEGRADFAVSSRLAVELKSTDGIADAHIAQVLYYLKATGFRLGLLINFNVALLKNGIERIINS